MVRNIVPPRLGPPQPRVGGRWRLGKEKGVTDFSVTPWHSSWWSWRESNPRPLECHASNILKLLIFFLSIVRLQQYFVGACQLDFGFLWRACHCAANRYLAAVVG